MLLLLAIVFIACKKGHELPASASFADHGTINLDYRACMTCGGYLIVFDKDTSTVYRSYQVPGNSGITSGTTFPVKAIISWKPDTSINTPHFITITSLKIDQ